MGRPLASVRRPRRLKATPIATALATAMAAPLLLAVGGAQAQGASDLTGYGQTLGSPQQQRELDYGTGTGNGSSLFDSSNPIDLMNRLRKATSLDDATPPADAIDAALSDFQAQTKPASAGSAAVKGP